MIVSLKQNRDFQRTYRKGSYKAGRFLVVYARENHLNHNRVGITTGKRFGNSVQRNRVKRLIRESYRQLAPAFKQGYDLIFMVRTVGKAAVLPNRKMKAVYVPTFAEIDKDIRKLSAGLKLL